jgi:hypothetical protein
VVDHKKEPKKPWPTQAVMDQIYKQNFWGGSESDFYSGDGSYDPSIVEPYLKAVASFLSDFNEPISVCDLGCGDFNIGKELVSFCRKYVAVDIVPDLIAHNKSKFQFENLTFQCIDIANENLPLGDCAILRQVLQHLSNSEVLRIVNKLQQYKYLIVTEHIPEGKFIPNADIISGQGIRLKKKSGIDLLASPFNLKVKSSMELCKTHLANQKGIIMTMLFTLR